MGQLLARIRHRIAHVLDPHCQERVAREAAALAVKLLAGRENFDLDAARHALGIGVGDLPAVTAAAYRKLLLQAWDDDEFTPDSKGGLAWAADKLRLPPDARRPLHLEVARQVFQRCLLATIEHGAADPNDLAQLQHIADCMDWEVADLVHHYFLHEGELLLGALFESLTVSGEIAADQWESVQQLAAWLGLSPQEMRAGMAPKVKRLLERLLAGARTDSFLPQPVDDAIAHVAKLVGVPREFQSYVKQELATLRILTSIERGELPVVSTSPDVEVEPGERIHFFDRVHYRPIRHVGVDSSAATPLIGSAALTNKRLIVQSPAKVTAVHHNFVMRLTPVRGGIEVFTPRGIDLYDFGPHNRLALVLYGALLKATPEALPPIEAGDRDAAWLRDDGRCAACGADHYLEFVRLEDHGSDHPPVHLMCTRCAPHNAGVYSVATGGSSDKKPSRAPSATF